MTKLTHVDEQGRARMVDVGGKPDTHRVAVARGQVRMRPETLALIRQNALSKGDALAAARIAGIMAAKKTAELIPLCHPLMLTHISVDLKPGPAHVTRPDPASLPTPGTGDAAGNADATPDEGLAVLEITATVETTGKTGVEMEALTAVTVAALTIYDMGKSVDRGMTITEISLAAKSGGKSGTYKRK